MLDLLPIPFLNFWMLKHITRNFGLGAYDINCTHYFVMEGVTCTPVHWPLGIWYVWALTQKYSHTQDSTVLFLHLHVYVQLGILVSKTTGESEDSASPFAEHPSSINISLGETTNFTCCKRTWFTRTSISAVWLEGKGRHFRFNRWSGGLLTTKISVLIILVTCALSS